MPQPAAPAPVTITATHPAERDRRLDAAVDALITHAAARRCGILVTRHAAATFSVRISPDVAYGTIREEQQW